MIMRRLELRAHAVRPYVVAHAARAYVTGRAVRAYVMGRAVRAYVVAVFFLAGSLWAQGPSAPPQQAPQSESLRHSFDAVDKKIDDVLWHLRLGDVADIDKVRITSSKPIRMKNPTGQGAGNPLVFWSYTFAPKNLKDKAPLLVFVHGGVHADFDSSYAHIVRELIDQGYVIVAPEYPGQHRLWSRLLRSDRLRRRGDRRHQIGARLGGREPARGSKASRDHRLESWRLSCADEYHSVA